jgi:hypothetical protein
MKDNGVCRERETDGFENAVGMPKHIEYARGRRESENAGLGFLVSSILHIFCRILKSYLTSGLCYAGNIFFIALPFIFLPCSNSGMSNLATQYEKH